MGADYRQLPNPKHFCHARAAITSLLPAAMDAAITATLPGENELVVSIHTTPSPLKAVSAASWFCGGETKGAERDGAWMGSQRGPKTRGQLIQDV